MESLSIGIFTYSTKPRGSVVHSACLAEALVALGQDVTLYALDKDGAGFFRQLAAPLRLIPAAPLSEYEPGSEALIAHRIREVAEFVSEHRPRHRILHAEDCLMASGLLSVRAQLPDAVICRTIHHVEKFESPFLEACQARSVRNADLCLTVSEQSQRDVLSHYGRSPQIVPNGVALERFSAATRGARSATRARLGIPDEAPVILSVGGVEPRKNSLAMLDAVLRLRLEIPDLRWVIAGGASIFEHREYRAAFADRLQDADFAIQTGVVPDDLMPALYGAADVLLHASLHEGFGLCVLEAMASELPVVVSLGPPFDEFADDQCALRVDPTDPSDIARALRQALLDDPNARVRAGHERASLYSWRRSAERHVAAYLQQLNTQQVSESRS